LQNGVNFADAITLLERGNDIVPVIKCIEGTSYDDGKGWPEIQSLFDGCLGCAEKPQIESVLRGKYNGTPTSAHLSKFMPSPLPFT